MVKFGGTGKSKQACVKRNCTNKDIKDAKDANEAESEDEEVDDIKIIYQKSKTLRDVSDDEDDEENNRNANNGKRKNETDIKGQKSIRQCFISLDKVDLPNGKDSSTIHKVRDYIHFFFIF